MVGTGALWDDGGVMTTDTETIDRTAAHATPRATRSIDERMLGGVAGGLAEHLGVPVLWVRGFFVVSCVLTGLGIVLYGALWLFMPLETRTSTAPGLEAATRMGRRPAPARNLRDVGVLVALGAIALGGIAIGQQVWSFSVIFWPVVIGIAGVAVLWWQADEAQRDRVVDLTGRVSLLRAVVGRGDWAAWVRVVLGNALIVGAIVAVGVQTGRATVAREVVFAGVIGIAGIALVLGPWLLRMAGELSDERGARIRQQERADVAAHLHDSVLQTLALIQKHSDDPRAVATLARAQERDLRSWLYSEEADVQGTVATALRAAAAEVEDAHGVPVEVVVVGDARQSERAAALVAAAREAMVNAAKHSAAPKVDVYAELSDSRAEVFVRDRGRGFDIEAVPADRLGIRNSIEGRMERHGGWASVRAVPGEGTEVTLTMEFAPEETK